MFDLGRVQESIRAFGFDAWLLYDFRGSNVLARRIVDLGEGTFLSRRWFYLIPAQGQPKKLVHRIEPHALDHLPGTHEVYLRWQELEERLRTLLLGLGHVAMEYAARVGNPYVSRVDAGTIEFVRSLGITVGSSGDLVQLFEACWDDDQWAMHLEAARHTRTAYDAAFAFIAARVRQGNPAKETEVQQCILDHFQKHDLVTDHPPICAVGPHSGDPHYGPSAATDVPVREGDFVLIDLWAKLNRARAVYSDLTWTGFVGSQTPARYEEVFKIVAGARDAAIATVRAAFANGKNLRGWEVDQAAREVIDKAGYGEAFCHRTGHSIGQETHGNGANMDNLETREERRVLPRTCFSVEPGIYLPEFGVRSEVNVFVDAQKAVHVTGGPPQTSIVPILAAY